MLNSIHELTRGVIREISETMRNDCRINGENVVERGIDRAEKWFNLAMAILVTTTEKKG